MIIVVDDMIFASNSERLLSDFKSKLAHKFDVKFFNEVKQFVCWEVKRDPNGIFISQGRYIRELLRKYDMEKCNGTLTPMAIEADIRPCQSDEIPLRKWDHSMYPKILGEIL